MTPRVASLAIGIGLALVLSWGLWFQAGRAKASAVSDVDAAAPDSPELPGTEQDSARVQDAAGEDLAQDEQEPSAATRSEIESVPSVTPAEPPTPAKTWQEVYSGYSLGQVVDESRKLRAAIDEVSLPYYQGAYDRGEYEVIGIRNPGERYVISGDEFDDLCDVTFFRDGRVARVVLPREQFAEAYVMKEKVQWLTARQEELERQPLTNIRLEPRR